MKKIKKPIRVLIAKCGRDGHSRGATVVTAALRNAGMEVVALGIHRSPMEVVNAAIQEDVDVIGLSQMDGGHMTVFRNVAKLLRERGAVDILLIGGGVIPEDEIVELKKEGISQLFGPGTPLREIVNYVREHAHNHPDATM